MLSDLQRILVIRPGALGDILLTLPALHALRCHSPGANLTLMASRPAAELLRICGLVDDIVDVDRGDLASLFLPSGSLDSSVRDWLQGYGLVVSYLAKSVPDLSSCLNSSTQVVHCDVRGIWQSRVHASVYLQQSLQSVGVAPCLSPPPLTWQPEEQRWADGWLSAHRLAGPWLAIHPGSGSRIKNWPADRFAAIVRQARQRYGLRVLLVGGPADGSVIGSLVGSLQDEEYVLAQDVPLPRLEALLRRCTLFLGNDSGVTHLAALVGVPVIVLFGPTDPQIWRPLGERVRVLASRAACAPCEEARRRVCTLGDCMATLGVDQVLKAIDELLAE